MIGTGTAPGTATLARFFPGAVIEGNVIVGGDAARYPRGNHFPGLARRASASRIRRAGTTALADGQPLPERGRGAGRGRRLAALAAAAPSRPGDERAALSRAPGRRDAYHGFWAVTFWVCAALLAYVYLGLSRAGWARAALAPRPRPSAIGPLPAVSVIVVAHDEADRIAARIDNLLALDYPRDRLEILIASDGSDGRHRLAGAGLCAGDGVARARVRGAPRQGRRAQRRRAEGQRRDRRARGRPAALRAGRPPGARRGRSRTPPSAR